MVDIDLAAIRAKDLRWVDRGRPVDSIGRDRRALLDYIDELESIMFEIAADLKIIKRTHRDNYLARLADPALLDVLDAELAAEQAENGRQGLVRGRQVLADFRESAPSGKLPP